MFLARDPTPADNSLTDGTVTLLPPPVVTLTPSRGPDGTKVLVKGSGFPRPAERVVIGQVDVMFDDMFIVFQLTSNGSFNFTLNVPLSQPGTHLIKVFDVFYGSKASAVFTVTPTVTGSLSLSVNVGTVYFPQDTVALFVLATFNGVPVSASTTTVTGLLIVPGGTNVTLNLVRQASGLYKATYSLSKTATLGTYVVLARAHSSSGLDATSVATFEVRLAWLSTGSGQATITTATVVGLAG